MRISNHNDANYLGRFKKYSFDAFQMFPNYGNKKNMETKRIKMVFFF